MIAYIVIEQQWEDSLISKQHIVNEIALYLVLFIAIACGLPLAPAAVSPLGLVLISLLLVTIVFNLIIISYVSVAHLRLYFKRHFHKKIQRNTDEISKATTELE